MSLGNLKKKNSFDGNLIFGAKKFNKQTNRDKHLKEVKKKNLKPFYLGQKNELLKKYSYLRKCPLCNSNIKKSKLIFLKGGFAHRKCQKCEMFYVSPILKNKISHKIHLNHVSFNKVYENRIQIKMDNLKFSYGLSSIKKHLKKNLKKKILDIGCGMGGFIEIAKKNKWISEGIEFNKYASKYLRKKGFKVYNDYLENLNLKKDYSCVSMWNLFEHLENPHQMLKNIKKVLVPGGLVFVLVPNIDGLVNRILKKDAVAFAGYTHLNFYNHKTLMKTFKKNEFRVLHFETIFTEIESIKNYLNFEDPYFGESNKNQNYFSSKFLHKNYLGSKLMMIAQNK